MWICELIGSAIGFLVGLGFVMGALASLGLVLLYTGTAAAAKPATP